MKGIKYEEIVEGNLKVTKDISDFGGPNMWRLNILTTQGFWEEVQWVNVYKAQKFFKVKLTVYNDESKVQYTVK